MTRPIIKIIIILAFVLISLACKQTTNDKQNDKSQAPVMHIELDSINPVESKWGDYIYYYKNVECYRIDAVVNDTTSFKHLNINNVSYYVSLIEELLVGYSYYFIVQEEPLMYFLSNKIELYDLDCSTYTLQSINIKSDNSSLTIFVDELEREIVVSVNPLNAGK